MTKLQPWVKFEETGDASAGRFVVSPLERGMGTTLGNALRRVLLSSLSGHAVTSLHIEGVKHEFSSIPHVVEDVFDVIANLKGIVFKSELNQSFTLTVDLSKKGKITAGSIKLPEGLEILNPDWYIAEVSENSKGKMQIEVEQGVGYATAEANRSDAPQEIDSIVMDSSFSPVLKVNHQVENIRVGKELDYDSLILDVWTNGSVDPQTAVQIASSILVSKFNLFESINEKPVSESVSSGSGKSAEKSQESILSLTVDDLELSARSSNCLKRAGIETVSELINKDLSELIQIKNFGKKSADEINAKLKQYGLALKGVEA